MNLLLFSIYIIYILVLNFILQQEHEVLFFECTIKNEVNPCNITPIKTHDAGSGQDGNAGICRTRILPQPHPNYNKTTAPTSSRTT